MESLIKFDKVILVKEFGKMQQIGKEYEVANVLDESLVLRDAKTKVAIGVVNFNDFNTYFKKVEEFKGWTQWQSVADSTANIVFKYRTNGKKVQVKTFEDKAEVCCNFTHGDEFNLWFGIELAYLRCQQKTDKKRRKELFEELQRLDSKIIEDKNSISRMIKSLDKEEVKDN